MTINAGRHATEERGEMTNYFAHAEALCERSMRRRPRPPQVVKDGDRRGCEVRLPQAARARKPQSAKS
jgi:hypothetical protein